LNWNLEFGKKRKDKTKKREKEAYLGMGQMPHARPMKPPSITHTQFPSS
jgi:hypothetical protein